MLLAANGDLVVASEHPFGMTQAVTTIRQYNANTGQLVRVFRPNASIPSVAHAACGLALRGSSFVWLRTKSSNSILHLAGAWVHLCAFRASMEWHWSFSSLRSRDQVTLASSG